MSQQQLSQRLADVVGYKLKRQAISEIEAGDRRVSVDEWLALSAALAVCPLYMVTPFESDEVVNEEAAEAGLFATTTDLRVGDRLALIPIEARRWIRGTAIYNDASVDDWPRFYCDEVPPAVRYRLGWLAAYVRDHARKLGHWVLPPLEVPAEYKTNHMAVPGRLDPDTQLPEPVDVPAPLWTWINSNQKEGS